MTRAAATECANWASDVPDTVRLDQGTEYSAETLSLQPLPHANPSVDNNPAVSGASPFFEYGNQKLESLSNPIIRLSLFTRTPPYGS